MPQPAGEREGLCRSLSCQSCVRLRIRRCRELDRSGMSFEMSAHKSTLSRCWFHSPSRRQRKARGRPVSIPPGAVHAGKGAQGGRPVSPQAWRLAVIMGRAFPPMSDSCDSLSPFQDGFRVRQTQGMGHDSRLNEHTKGGRKVGEGAKGRGERTSSDEDLNPVPDSLPADGADSQGLAALKAGAMSALEDQFDLVVDADRAGDALLHLAVAAL